MSSRPVYRMCAQLVPSGEWGHPFLAAYTSGLNLVIAAVLRYSLCVVSLLPCMADCCMSHTVCKFEPFVLTVINQRLLSLLLVTKWLLHYACMASTVSEWVVVNMWDVLVGRTWTSPAVAWSWNWIAQLRVPGVKLMPSRSKGNEYFVVCTL